MLGQMQRRLGTVDVRRLQAVCIISDRGACHRHVTVDVTGLHLMCI